MRATITPAGEQRVSRSQIRTETRRRDQVFVTDSLASTSDRRLAERPFGSCATHPWNVAARTRRPSPGQRSRSNAWRRLRCAGVSSYRPRVECSAEREAGEAEDHRVANNANRAQSEHV